MSRNDGLNNHANQLNPNNDAYWEVRGYGGRPDDWEDRIDRQDYEAEPGMSSKRRIPRSNPEECSVQVEGLRPDAASL